MCVECVCVLSESMDDTQYTHTKVPSTFHVTTRDRQKDTYYVYVGTDRSMHRTVRECRAASMSILSVARLLAAIRGVHTHRLRAG